MGSTLDDASPRDILLAISPTHYLEYLPSKDTYTSRIYFTEFLGGVIGANAMQGHSILFDWENGRIGFAASTCDHDDLLNNEVSHMVNKKVGHLGKEGGVVDCALSPPSLATTCVESVDKESCVNDPVSIADFRPFQTPVLSVRCCPTILVMLCWFIGRYFLKWRRQ